QASGSAPAEIAPAQVFPRLAAASIGLTWSELALREMQQAHPGIALSKPAWRRCDFAWTTLERMQVEPRNGRRRKRRFCQGRQQQGRSRENHDSDQSRGSLGAARKESTRY